MYYLEVKIDKKNNSINDTSNFISDVINAQNSLGIKKDLDCFENNKLIKLGFTYNPNTNGFSIQEDFNIKQLTKLTKKITKLEHHILVHGYIELKIHNNKLFFWDKSLIYEGMDTFEYCLKYHNILRLNNLTVLTKSNSINEDLLNLVNFTRRYYSPTIEFITQNCLWDKKEGYKILNHLIVNRDEYLPIDNAKNFN